MHFNENESSRGQYLERTVLVSVDQTQTMAIRVAENSWSWRAQSTSRDTFVPRQCRGANFKNQINIPVPIGST